MTLAVKDKQLISVERATSWCSATQLCVEFSSLSKSQVNQNWLKLGWGVKFKEIFCRVQVYAAVKIPITDTGWKDSNFRHRTVILDKEL